MPIDQVSTLANGATGSVGVGGLGAVTGMLQGGISNMLNLGSSLLDRILPPAKREDLKQKLTRFATEKPYLASFLLSQIAFSGLPMFLFVIMVISIAIFALLTGLLVGLLGAVLFILAAVGFALLILLPTLFFTTFAAVGVWLFGVGSYYLIKHFNKGDVPGVHVPMADGVKKATGLDDLVPGLGLKQQGQNQESQSQSQANGTVEKRPVKEKESKAKPAEEGGVSQPVKRKASSNKEPSEVKSPAGHVKSAASGVGGAVNGIGNAVGVGV